MKKQNIKSYLLVIVLTVSAVLKAQTVVTINNAIELALDNNYGIKIANNTVEEAKNNSSVLNSGFLPTLDGVAGAAYSSDNINAEFANGGTAELTGAESSRYNAALNLNYTLFDGLGRLYNYKSLKETYNLTEVQARETIENTIVQLLTVYYDVAKRYENLTSLKTTLDISKDRLNRASYQFEYGQNTKLDVLNAEVDINNDSINLINSKQGLTNAKRDLNFVTGNTIQGVFDVDTGVEFLLSLKKEDLLQKLKNNNVALIQVEKNIKISEFTIKANKSGYLPSVGLIGTYGWNENFNNPAAFVSVLTNVGVTLGANLTWNLFDGGGTITRVKNAQIALENQKLQKEQLVLSVVRDFENMWDDYQNKLAVYQIQENNIITATNNFERTEEKYKLGQATSIEFRQAQLNLLTAELRKNDAKYDAKLSEIVVLQLSGELLNTSF